MAAAGFPADGLVARARGGRLSTDAASGWLLALMTLAGGLSTVAGATATWKPLRGSRTAYRRSLSPSWAHRERGEPWSLSLTGS